MRAVLLSLSLLAAAGCEKATPHQEPQAAKEITTKSGVAMVLVPAGEFVMGDEAGEVEETPAHRVKVGAFYIDKYEVTQEAYRSLMGDVPRQKSEGDKRPVAAVPWLGALRYCNARSQREGLAPCYDLATQSCDFQADGYRLPTEAEWEYACRAGTKGDYSFGNDVHELAQYAWHKSSSVAAAAAASHDVGGRKPNPWGLYDMQGNVSEWCNDWYGETYYKQRESDNPRGPATGRYRALRGGNFASSADTCRSSSRHYEAPGFADACFGRHAIGFRCVRRAP